MDLNQKLIKCAIKTDEFPFHQTYAQRKIALLQKLEMADTNKFQLVLELGRRLRKLVLELQQPLEHPKRRFQN